MPKRHDLRPTPNIVRETLFNWLAPVIEQGVCLDVFAGSGALGFEALSRGAVWVSFLDRSSQIVSYLKQQVETFNVSDCVSVDRAHFPLSNIPSALCSQSFTLVFLDPPFRKGLLEPSLQWLLKHQQILASNAWIYVEHEAGLPLLDLGESWQWIKKKQTGQIAYGLLEYRRLDNL